MHIALFITAIVSLSQSPNLIRLANAPLDVIGFWRLLGAGILMAGFTLWRTKTLWPSKSSRRARLLTFLSGTFFFLHLWTYTYAAQNTSVANTMILFNINPLVTALAGIILFKEKLAPRLIWAYLFGIASLYLLLSDKFDFFASAHSRGNWLALFSAALYSGYVLCGNQVRKTISNLHFSWVIYLWTAVLFFVSGTSREVSWLPYPNNTWLAIFGMIVLPTFLGHSLFTYLFKHLNINWMSCGKLLEPALASFIAFFLFKENPPARAWAAFACTMISIFILFAPWQLKAKARAKK